MIETVEIKKTATLDDYCALPSLAGSVQSMREEAESLLSRLRGRKLWMVNSTANGGGVAEMLPQLVSILCELGLPTEWVVMGSNQPDFFVLTKRLHNMIHGEGDAPFTESDRALYEAVARENAERPEGPHPPRRHSGDPRSATAGNGFDPEAGAGHHLDLSLPHRTGRRSAGEPQRLELPQALRRSRTTTRSSPLPNTSPISWRDAPASFTRPWIP